MATENPFVKLFAIDFKDHLEVKKSGNTELKYVSWAYAWAEVKKLYPSASYEVKKFNGLPYVYDPITGFMVYTMKPVMGSWCTPRSRLRAFRTKCGCLYWIAQIKR